MAVTQRFHQSVFGNQEETTSQFKSRSVGPKERISYARQMYSDPGLFLHSTDHMIIAK